MRQEARPLGGDGVHVTVPDFMAEIVATFTHLARRASHVNQRSGVSVRLSRRQLRDAGRQRRAPGAARRRDGRSCRACRDLEALAVVDVGQGRDRVARRRPRRPDRREPGQGGGAHRLQGARRHRPVPRRRRRLRGRRRGRTPARTCRRPTTSRCVEQMPALREPVAALDRRRRSPAAVASAVEFVLEGLHLSKRLNKDAVGTRATYRSRTWPTSANVPPTARRRCGATIGVEWEDECRHRWRRRCPLSCAAPRRGSTPRPPGRLVGATELGRDGEGRSGPSRRTGPAARRSDSASVSGATLTTRTEQIATDGQVLELQTGGASAHPNGGRRPSGDRDGRWPSPPVLAAQDAPGVPPGHDEGPLASDHDRVVAPAKAAAASAGGSIIGNQPATSSPTCPATRST